MEEFPQFDPTIAEEFGFDTATAGSTFLGTPLFEADSLINLFIRFFFNLLMCWIITQFFYYKKSKRRDYYLTFMLFSATMFVLIFLMENVKLQIGFTLGLFAIFGMIRYRTETVPVREMTYLFIIIGISVINGLAMAVSVAELVCANLLIIALIAVLESTTFLRQVSTKIVLYEKIDLIVPEKREELMADLRKRTGIQNIQKIEIGHIDFLRDVAYIKLYYILGKNETNTIDTITKFKES
jgi:hypothetical protein